MMRIFTSVGFVQRWVVSGSSYQIDLHRPEQHVLAGKGPGWRDNRPHRSHHAHWNTDQQRQLRRLAVSEEQEAD